MRTFRGSSPSAKWIYAKITLQDIIPGDTVKTVAIGALQDDLMLVGKLYLEEDWKPFTDGIKGSTNHF